MDGFFDLFAAVRDQLGQSAPPGAFRHSKTLRIPYSPSLFFAVPLRGNPRMQPKKPLGLLSRIFRQPTPLADRKPLCAGEATGYQCRHYLPRGRVAGGYTGEIGGVRIRFDDEPEFQRTRHCTVTSPTNPLDKDPAKLPSYCPAYEAASRRFDPLFEQPPRKDIDLPAHLPGAHLPGPVPGEATMATAAVMQSRQNLGHTGPNMPARWDDKPGAPVLPRQPGDAADAPARRGFTHLEIEDKRTACGSVNSTVLCATLVPGDHKATIAQVNCPGCLAERASNVGIDGIVKTMADRLMDQMTAEANKAHDESISNPHVNIEASLKEPTDV